MTMRKIKHAGELKNLKDDMISQISMREIKHAGELKNVKDEMINGFVKDLRKKMQMQTK